MRPEVLDLRAGDVCLGDVMGGEGRVVVLLTVTFVARTVEVTTAVVRVAGAGALAEPCPHPVCDPSALELVHEGHETTLYGWDDPVRVVRGAAPPGMSTRGVGPPS